MQRMGVDRFHNNWYSGIRYIHIVTLCNIKICVLTAHWTRFNGQGCLLSVRDGDQVSMSECYGEAWTVVASQLNRFFSPAGNILGEEPGRSWVPSDAPNLSGVKQELQQSKFCTDTRLPNELGRLKGGSIWSEYSVWGGTVTWKRSVSSWLR